MSRILIRKVADFSIYAEKIKRLMAWANFLNQTLPISRDMAHDEREEAVTRDTFPLLLQFLGYFLLETWIFCNEKKVKQR